MPHALEADAECLTSLCNGNSNWNRTESRTFYFKGLEEGGGRKSLSIIFLQAWAAINTRMAAATAWVGESCVGAWRALLGPAPCLVFGRTVLEGWLRMGGVWGPYFHCAPLVSGRDGGLCRFNSGGGCSRGGFGLRCGLGSGWLGGWSGASRTSSCFVLQKHQRAGKEAVKCTCWLPQFNRWGNRGSKRVTQRDKGYQELFGCLQEKPTGTRMGLWQGWGCRVGSAQGFRRDWDQDLKPLEMEIFFSLLLLLFLSIYLA